MKHKTIIIMFLVLLIPFGVQAMDGFDHDPEPQVSVTAYLASQPPSNYPDLETFGFPSGAPQQPYQPLQVYPQGDPPAYPTALSQGQSNALMRSLQPHEADPLLRGARRKKYTELVRKIGESEGMRLFALIAAMGFGLNGAKDVITFARYINYPDIVVGPLTMLGSVINIPASGISLFCFLNSFSSCNKAQTELEQLLQELESQGSDTNV